MTVALVQSTAKEPEICLVAVARVVTVSSKRKRRPVGRRRHARRLQTLRPFCAASPIQHRPSRGTATRTWRVRGLLFRKGRERTTLSQ